MDPPALHDRMLRVARARGRTRERLERAIQKARAAIGKLLDMIVIGPAAPHHETGFCSVTAAVDAGVALSTTSWRWRIEPEAMLQRLALHPASGPLDPQHGRGSFREGIQTRFIHAYTQGVEPVRGSDLAGVRRRANLHGIGETVGFVFGPTSGVRSDEDPAGGTELFWLEPRPVHAQLTGPAALDGMNTVSGDPRLDPLIVAALGYAQVLVTQPFVRWNAAAALLVLDQALRAVPGCSAGRLGMARGLFGDGIRPGHDLPHKLRHALGKALRGDAWTAWTIAFLQAITHAAAATADRAQAHAQAIKAIEERLSAPDAHALLDRKRIRGDDLVDLCRQRPYLSIKLAMNTGSAGRKAAATCLDLMERLELGTGERSGRNRLLRLTGPADAFSRR